MITAIPTTDGPQFMMVRLTIFQLYDGVEAIHIQNKRYFGFWILIFSWVSDMWYDTLLRGWAVVASG